MQKYPDQQNVYAVVKKLAQAGNRQGVIEAISEEISGSSPESLIDELSRWLLHMRAALRTVPPQNKISLSVLIEALGEIARKKGIPASRFYPHLLEKILIEEAEETTPLPPKLERQGEDTRGGPGGFFS